MPLPLFALLDWAMPLLSIVKLSVAMPLLCYVRVSFPRFASETAIFRRSFVTSPNLSVRRSFLITERLNRYYATPLLFLCISFHSHAPHCHCHAKLILSMPLRCCPLPCRAMPLPCPSLLGYAFALLRSPKQCPCAYSKMSAMSAARSSKISQRNLPLPLFLHCPSPRSFP